MMPPPVTMATSEITDEAERVVFVALVLLPAQVAFARCSKVALPEGEADSKEHQHRSKAAGMRRKGVGKELTVDGGRWAVVQAETSGDRERGAR